LGSTVY